MAGEAAMTTGNAYLLAEQEVLALQKVERMCPIALQHSLTFVYASSFIKGGLGGWGSCHYSWTHLSGGDPCNHYFCWQGGGERILRQQELILKIEFN